MVAQMVSLPPDNHCRIAIFDALYSSGGTLGRDDLRDRVSGRLRLLAPQEIHNQGFDEFFGAKLNACLKAGLVAMSGAVVTLGSSPSITYPDGSTRQYTPGLVTANERLVRDNQRLRNAGFDPAKVIPSIADDPQSDQYKHLVRSMREHGWVSSQRLVKFGDATVDGRAREAAAREVGIKLTNPHLTHQPAHRQSILDQVTLMLDLNASRLGLGDVAKAKDAVASLSARSWEEIAHDLTLTSQWRQAEGVRKSAPMETELVPFEEGGEPIIPVSTDGQWVGIRKLVSAAGLDAYDTYPLVGRGFSGPNPEQGYMNMADVRQIPTGLKRVFVRPLACADAIAAMRQATQPDLQGKWKPGSGWDLVEAWLRRR